MELLSIEKLTDTAAPWAHAVHDQAKAKGWWKDGVEERSPGNTIFLMISELSESFEVYRLPDREIADIWMEPTKENPEVKKPEGLPVELADTIIRCLDHIAALAPTCGGDAIIQISALDALDDKPQINPETVYGDIMMAITKMLCGAHNAFFTENSSKERNRRRAIRQLMGVVVTILAMSDALSLDVPKAVELKHAYNGTRSQRHGGKKA